MSFWSDPLGSIQGTFSDPSERKGLGELALGALAIGTMNPELLGLGGAGATVAPVTELSTLDATGLPVTGTAAGWGGTSAVTPIGADMAEGYGASAAGTANTALAPSQVSALSGAANPYALTSGTSAAGLSPTLASSGFNAAGTDAVSSGITGLNPATAQTAFNAGADSAIANGASSSLLGQAGSALSSAGSGLMNFIKAHPYMSAAAALAAYSALGGTKPNYMTPYQPPTAASYGLGSTLAAGYKPYRPMASGGITSLAMGGVPGDPYPQSHISNDIYHAPTQLPTTANQMVGYQTDNLPMAQSIDNSMASGGMTAAGESSGPLQTYQAPSTSGTSLQDLASQYGVSLPSNIGAAQGGIMGLADGGPLQQLGSPESNAIDPKTGIPYGQEHFGQSGGFFGGLGQSVDNIGHSITDGIGSIGRSIGFAHGGNTGTYNLGGYSDGGRLLKGPGDGMSDNIPASIADKQPARLADGEFVVPADVVSHLGNGSTDAGAKHLYTMMDKVRKARTGHSRQGKQIDAQKYMPA